MDTSNWVRLTKIETDFVPRATRFLVKDSGIYEKMVELFMVESPFSPSGFAVYVSTGQKAGCLLVHLPQEASAEEVRAISKNWLLKNWRKWLIDTDPAAVLCKHRYDVETEE